MYYLQNHITTTSKLEMQNHIGVTANLRSYTEYKMNLMWNMENKKH